MENIYRTTFIRHIKSLKYVLIQLSLLILFFILPGQIQLLESKVVVCVALFVCFMLFFPPLYLHITYYFENIGLEIKIDELSNMLTILKGRKEYVYSLSNIISVERSLGLYYKDRIRFSRREFDSWTPYGYLTIKLNDGLSFRLTCLMIDIHNPPFQTTHTFFRFFPYLTVGKKFSEKRAIVKQNFENEISNYKSTFKNYSNRQLEEKIKNYKTYDKASVEASKQLLANRQT